MKKLKILTTFLSVVLYSCDQSYIENQTLQNTITNDYEEINMCSFDLHNQVATSKLEAASIHNRWVPGQTIKIKFLNGDPIVQEKVKKYANEWTEYANLKFEYVEANQDANIRIGFQWDGDVGSWSVLGTNGNNTVAGQKIPNMNFGWLFPNTGETTYKRVVLHEFGHALGLIHEHQNPSAGINWDKPKVYDYYEKNNNWSKSDVDSNIFMKYNLDQTNYTEYDPLSIMHYNIHYSLTTDGFFVKEKSELSPTDKNFISRIYPKSSLQQGEFFSKSSKEITSPNGKFSLIIRSEKLVIYNNITKSDLWNFSPNVKINNITSTNVYCILINGEFLLFKGNISRTVTGYKSISYPECIILKNSGDLEIIKNNISVWSLFKGKLM